MVSTILDILSDTELPIIISGNYINPKIDIKISDVIAKKLKDEIKNKAIESIKDKIKDKIQSDIKHQTTFLRMNTEFSDNILRVVSK